MKMERKQINELQVLIHYYGCEEFLKGLVKALYDASEDMEYISPTASNQYQEAAGRISEVSEIIDTMTEYDRNIEVKVVKSKKGFGKDGRQGIHLLNPTDTEVEQAKQNAIAKGFDVVYIHRSKNNSEHGTEVLT